MRDVAPPTIAREVIECIAEGRDPSADELALVASRIGNDVRGMKSAFAWGELGYDGSEQLLTMRAARAALAGSPARS
jgi:hypothetical protein